MAITRLKRKHRKNIARANNKQRVIKQLLSTPVIKNVDPEELKAQFGKNSTTNAAPAQTITTAPAATTAAAPTTAAPEVNSAPEANSAPAAANAEGGLFNSVKDAISGAAQTVVDRVEDAVEAVKDKVEDVFSKDEKNTAE